MNYATGPWHSPPLVPDGDEFCLVFLLHKEGSFRYAVLRYVYGWYHQNGRDLEPEYEVSRWAYVAGNMERMSELRPVRNLPVDSRLFVPGALTEYEKIRMLLTLVTALKRERARLRIALKEGASKHMVEQMEKQVRAVIHDSAGKIHSQRQQIDELVNRVNLAERQVSHEVRTARAATNFAEQRVQHSEARCRKLEAEVARLNERLVQRFSQDAMHVKLTEAVRLGHAKDKMIAELERRLRTITNEQPVMPGKAEG